MHCLLCLQTNQNYKSFIIFNSSEWQELNIHYIIEKHLWKMENLNSQSYICQACWKELYNFHQFYSKIENAYSKLNASLHSDEVSKGAGETENKSEADKISNNSEKESQIKPEILFLREENLLEIFEKEDEEKVNCLERSTESKRSKKKSTNDKINFAKNISEKTNYGANKLKYDENPEIFENEDEEKVNCLERSTRSRKKSTNDKINFAKNSSEKKSNTEKTNYEGNKRKADENPYEMDTKLQLEGIESSAKEIEMKSDKNGLISIGSKLELKTEENEAEENKMEESIDYQNDSLKNDDDHSSRTVDLYQLDEDDKFIAENFQIICNLCQTSLATYAVMLTHYRDEHNQRGYASCCNKKYYPRAELIDHIKLHQNPEYFKCKFCDKLLTRRTNLKTHIKEVHVQQNVTCDICHKVLAKGSLKAHMTLHETDDNKKLPCKHCPKTFFSKPALTKHIRIVHLKINYQICDLCGKSILKTSFERHMCEHEGKPPPTVNCEICGRLLSDMGCLKRHMSSHHPPDGVIPQFKCPECKKVYNSHANLKNHIRSIHERKYERKCSLCGQTFKGPGSLKEHMSRHAGQPLHACTFCPKVFYSNGNMYAHRKKEHPIELEKSIREKFYANLPENGTSTDSK